MLDAAQAPLLIQTTVDDGDFVDAVTGEGCLDLGLPATYPLELRRPDARVDLRRVDARVAEQGSHLLEVVVLLEDLHDDAVPQVVRLELRVADHLAVHFAEPPDVLPRHRRTRLADAPAAPR
jgi:hypothetical protein